MGVENIEHKGTKSSAEFQGNMTDAAKPLVDSIPEIGSLFFRGLMAPFAFFF